MHFELDDEHRQLKELVSRFVREELMPLENVVLAREANGEGLFLQADEKSRLDKLSNELGLWGLDAPEDVGGVDLPVVAMIGVNEEMGRTVTPYTIPPDSPNLRMLMVACNEQQKKDYLEPYVKGGTISAIGISEPGAGSDPSAMKTTASKTEEGWVLNGTKIWISRAAEADFTIVMAVTDKELGSRGGISAFLLDKDTPGMKISRRIPMLAGAFTYEVVFEDCEIPDSKLLGKVGGGFVPMQVRLSTRRLEMASWCIGLAQRALDMMVEHSTQRTTFGKLLAERQTVQAWVADAATEIHACRLMTYHAAWKLDQGNQARSEISMVKRFSTEMAWKIVDNAMQCFGAMGVTKEMPLHLMAAMIRNMRVYDGPSEIHQWVIARDILNVR